MAIRNTADDVKEIMESCDLTDPVIERFISASSELVDRVFVSNTIVSAILLKEIECWFAAHMIASSKIRQTSEEKLGDAWVRYGVKFGKNLESTTYGQMVLQLDISGKMAAATGKQRMRMVAIKSFD